MDLLHIQETTPPLQETRAQANVARTLNRPCQNAMYYRRLHPSRGQKPRRQLAPRYRTLKCDRLRSNVEVLWERIVAVRSKAKDIIQIVTTDDRCWIPMLSQSTCRLLEASSERSRGKELVR